MKGRGNPWLQGGNAKSLEELRKLLGELSSKLDTVMENQEEILMLLSAAERGRRGNEPSFPLNLLDVMTLLHLPDHLRQTAMAVVEKGVTTAVDVSKVTKRCRAIESHHLNELVRSGHLKKFRKGRTVHFSVE